MTMQREAKAEALTAYSDTLTGRIQVLCPSPRWLLIHGRYMPAEQGAKMYLAFARPTHKVTREFWATDRTGRRKITRKA